MGRALFYCGSCGRRLTGADLESGQAIRVGEDALCAECAPMGQARKAPPPAKVPPTSRTPVVAGRGTTRRSQPVPTKRALPERKTVLDLVRGRRGAVILGGGIAGVAALILIVFVFSGSKGTPEIDLAPLPSIPKKDPVPPPAPPSVPEPPVPPPGPPAPPPTEPSSEEELRRRMDEALADLDRQTRELCSREEFGKALGLWESARPRFEAEAWAEFVEAGIRDVRRQAAALWKSMVEATPPEGRAGLRDRVKVWGLPEIAGELEDMLKPKELSPALKAYREAWGRAAAKAAAGEWDAALAELGSPEDEEARAEAEADRALFEKVKALPAVPKIERGRVLAIRYAKGVGEYAAVQGRVVRLDEQRIELEIEDKKRVFVEWEDFSAGTRAGLLAAAGGDPAALAALCLLAGDLEAAEGIATRDMVPKKYWTRAAEGKAEPPPRDRGEYEARDLFHSAELDWRDPDRLGEAIEKYKMLLRDYVGTSLVIRNMVLVTKRSEAGKDYVFLPVQLKASGVFGRAKHEDVPLALTLSRDVSGPEERTTFVDVGFYALPGTAYKGWALLGGCCAETFTVYYQTTEGKGRDPKTRKEYDLEPGGGVAMPLEHRIRFLKSRHSTHGGEKKPSRWEWVSLPLPEQYPAPGRKVFRFLASQQGFSVAYVVISSVREREPDKEETAALAERIADLPAEAELEISGLWVKNGKPYEWFSPKAGDKVYIDRNYTIASLPAILEGTTALRVSNSDKGARDMPFITFEVNMDVTVYVACDPRVSSPGWMKDWKKTGEEFGMSERGLPLFAKDFPAGKVELGGSAAPRENAAVVFVAPRR